jgi:Uma2 family endonuclease
MPTTMPAAITTADELLLLHEPGHRHELVRGELRRMSPAGHWHGSSGSILHALLTQFVRERRLGRTFLAETGFLLATDPDTVLAPDLAFVRCHRLPPQGPGYFPGPPDLAVEVASPGDSPAALRERAQLWLLHGASTVWIVDPVARTVAVHRQEAPVLRLDENDVLVDADLLPGFSIAIRELFAWDGGTPP